MSEMKPGEQVNIFKDPLDMDGQIESGAVLVSLIQDDGDALEYWKVHMDNDPLDVTYQRWINKTQVHE